MSTTHQGKPGGKNRQRNKKADQRGQTPQSPPSPTPDPRDEDQIDAIVASAIVATTEDVSDEASTDAPASAVATPADHHPAGIQTIANVYGDYSRKSLQESLSFAEKLMAVRSLDKAVEVQTEFAKATYANFSEFYRELAKQIFQPQIFQPQIFQPWGFAARMTEAGRTSWPAVASQSQH
jgi:hypothetical protein